MPDLPNPPNASRPPDLPDATRLPEPPAAPTLLARYTQILEDAVLHPDELQREMALADAFDLGRSLLATATTPDDVVSLHHDALQHFAQQHPQAPLDAVVARLTLPLMELTMAHGMAFREQLQFRHRQEMAVRMEQASRLEALGTLAAGVAHDFNTLLGSILGYAELTGDELAAGSAGRAYLEQIGLACARARDLIRRMLEFASQRPAHPVEQDLVAQIEAALTLLRPGLARDIDLQWRHAFAAPAQRPRVLADPGQIQQIVMNLCLNAADAMPHGGRLHLALDRVAAAGPGLAPAVRPNDLCLQVTDTGCGMPPEVVARIFEPFFTTKAPKGSGLGLSVVYGIVKQLGGEVNVASRCVGPEAGTRFQVFLPALPDAPGELSAEAPHGAHPDH